MNLEKPFQEQPDFEHFRKVIMRETGSGPVPIIELVVDPEIMSAATGFDFPADGFNKLTQLDPDAGSEEKAEFARLGLRYLDLTLEFSKTVGYDYVTMVPIVPLRRPARLEVKSSSGKNRNRIWQNEQSGLITSRGELEEFLWPRPDQVSLFPIDYAAGKMAPGMKVMSFFFGIFEDLRSLMGYETLAIKSIEEPDLPEEILERLTVLGEQVMEKVASHPAVGAVFYADDLGFNTATMLSPKWMRQYLIPRQKRLADICHRHGKPFLLHSCGQVDAMMEDLIEVVKIDGRHAYQDNVEPVEQVYQKYGTRISILGGLDVNLLATASPEQVRARTRRILEACAPRGGFCVGSGNSVTNYCRMENYYAMLEETRNWNDRHG